MHLVHFFHFVPMFISEFTEYGSVTLVQYLDFLSDVLSGQHSGVGGGLVSVGLDLHAAGDTADGLTPGQVGDVHEGVVEGGVDVSHAEDQLTFLDLGSKRDLDLLLGFLLSLTRSHVIF